jgi:hypothetical protein
MIPHGIISHVLPFDVTVLIFYMKVMNALIIAEKVRPKKALKISLGEITPIYPNYAANSTQNP